MTLQISEIKKELEEEKKKNYCVELRVTRWGGLGGGGHDEKEIWGGDERL